MAKGKDVMEEKKEAEEQIARDTKEQIIPDKQDSKISELESQNAELIDLLKRKQAEFENYRKRIEKDQCEYAKHSSDRLICELLEVLDNFSLSLKHGIDEKGVKMIYEQFLLKLQKLGVIEYSMLGKKFDSNFCEVLCVQSSNDKEDGIVVDEIAKGYMVHDKVLRCAKVIINRKDVEKEISNKEQKEQIKNHNENIKK